jgi:hypothetical protein
MLPDSFNLGKHHEYTVSLNVTGDEGDFLGDLLTSNDLEAAIETSLIQSGIFSKVVLGSGADYQLTVNADANVPGMGGDLTAKVSGIWQLEKSSTKKIIMDEFVTSSGTATFSESFSGSNRLKIALARAAKKFIEEGIRQLGKLDF